MTRPPPALTMFGSSLMFFMDFAPLTDLQAEFVIVCHNFRSGEEDPVR